MNWQIDPTHSHLSFAIRVLSVTTTRGRFHALRGHLHIDEQNPANSWVEAEVDAASIDTHNKLRDAHLRSAAFFAVKQYPTITFTEHERRACRWSRLPGDGEPEHAWGDQAHHLRRRIPWSEHSNGRECRPQSFGADQSQRFWRGPGSGSATGGEFDGHHRD